MTEHNRIYKVVKFCSKSSPTMTTLPFEIELQLLISIIAAELFYDKLSGLKARSWVVVFTNRQTTDFADRSRPN